MRKGFSLTISSVFVVAILIIPLSTVMAAEHQQTANIHHT
jgi:hypothetical protein